MLARTEHTFLEEIGRRLPSWVSEQVVWLPSSISVKASGPDGFDVMILLDDGRYILACDEWTEEFDDADLARGLFAAALDGNARLKVDTVNGRRWRWALERRNPSGQWMALSTVSHPVWRRWGEPSVVYLRNGFAPLDGRMALQA